MKPKHLPRLWCAMQGLLPLIVQPVTDGGGEKTPPVAPAKIRARPVVSRGRRRG